MKSLRSAHKPVAFLVVLFSTVLAVELGYLYGGGYYGDPAPNQLEFGRLLHPAQITYSSSELPPLIYGAAFSSTLTAAPGQTAGLTAEVGFSDNPSDLIHSTTWYFAPYAYDEAGADIFAAELPRDFPPGTYYYYYRFCLPGEPCIYGDLDGSANGIQTEQLGTLNVLVVSPTPSPTLIPTQIPTATPTLTPIPTPTPHENDQDGDGYDDAFELEQGFDPNDPCSQPALGDVDGDGRVTIRDAILLYRWKTGLMDGTGLLEPDLNCDGVADVRDALVLYRWIANPALMPVIPICP